MRMVRLVTVTLALSVCRIADSSICTAYSLSYTTYGGDKRNDISVSVKARKEWWKRRSFLCCWTRSVRPNSGER